MKNQLLSRDMGSAADRAPDESKRDFLRSVAALLVGLNLPQTSVAGGGRHGIGGSGQRVVVMIFGGVRREETFSKTGFENIPHLSGDLLSHSLFYQDVRNEGVTAHYNAISSILTGNWQRVDDWGKLAPSTPTLFEYFRKETGAAQSDTWVVASNKALTNLIGASSVSGYGTPYGANVVFPKQLMIAAMANALRSGRSGGMADRAKIEAEFASMLQAGNYEGLGWSVFDGGERLDPRVRDTIQEAITSFVESGGPTSGDELTYLVSREVMRKFSPRLLVVILSDVEVAHFGSYAMHLGGIRTGDRLAYEMWNEINLNSEYKEKTTLVVLPEFGRDPDGSTTNGFFNHRGDTTSTRSTWMMVSGAAINKPEIVDRPVRHVDLCTTLMNVLGCKSVDSQGKFLREWQV